MPAEEPHARDDGGDAAEPATISHDAEAPLGERFLAVSRRLRRGYMAALEPLGITPHQARALRVVVGRGPLRLGVLAEELRVAPRSVTDVVDWLAERGLVARTADPRDRRAVAVEATNAGRTLASQVDALRREHADDFFGHLGAADQAALGRLLDLLNRNT